MPFEFRSTEIADVMLIEPLCFQDQRGFFMEIYRESEFLANCIRERFVQDNYSHSMRGVLRGLHYQKNPKAQGKLVTVVKGEIFDVAVDIRRGSPSYGRWVGVVLSSENRLMLYIPVGFAHGYCVLSDEADVVYKVTEEYTQELDRGIIWNDSKIAIKWPVKEPVISPRDARLPLLEEADNNFVFMGEMAR
ncbi:MAG TPA: dTDP-4-dehydrorhamnose 3,5-epimerase [Thermodesulfobacteriota bacterium]|nr:dTDP-4-dehydrorhamnose 3,5-epimerase [Thermodesulfobacteriota bacterium]